MPSPAPTRPPPGGVRSACGEKEQAGQPHGSKAKRTEPRKTVATLKAPWQQAGKQPEDPSWAARSAQEAARGGEQDEERMTGKTPTQAGIDVGSSVVKNASLQSPLATMMMVISAVLMAGSIWLMYSEVKESRKELLGAVDSMRASNAADIARHEGNGHASAVTKIELTSAIAGLQRGIEKLSEKMDNQTNAINARIDRLIERNK